MPAFPTRLVPRRLLALTLALAGAAAGAQGRLPADVSAALARAKVPPEALAVLVVDAEGRGPARLTHRSSVPMNPASVMKLVTTYAALDLLGPNYSWSTPVYVEGTAREGTLYGNVYLKGQGDPKLVMERLWLLLRRLRGLDIRTIAGDIVLDRSAFEVAAPDPGEFDGERLRPYNAAPDALLLNYKAVVMTFVPDRAANAAHVSYDPPLAGVQLQTHVPLIDTDCGDYRAALRADLSDPARLRFAGRYPASCGEKVWPLAYADPASYAVRAVEGMWREVGGQLQGRVREGSVPAGLAPAFELASPPLTEVIRDINKYSNNVMAQQLFLTLGLQQQGSGSYAAARDTVQAWWKERFGPTDPPVLDNGSGLSRSARITAQGLATLLQSAWRSPLLPELAASLPISGIDGTLRRVRNGSQGSAHLKTGSLRDVTAMAGYVDGLSGRRYVLVAMANHANAPAARPALEALIEWTRKDR